MNSIGSISTPSSSLKNSLLQKVNILKNDIEIIVKLNKTQISNEERKENTSLKQEKLTELKKLNEDLKSIYKKEKIEINKRNEMLSIQKTMDSLDFRAAKKKNNSEAMDRAKKAKEQRELLRKTYIESREIEKRYLEKDSKLLPGNLFLDDNIIKKYGLCPFIDIPQPSISKVPCHLSTASVGVPCRLSTASVGVPLSEELEESNEEHDEIYYKRLEWLESREDKGEYYYNLYKDFYQNEVIDSLTKEKEKIEESIDQFIKKTLSNSQFEIYNDSIIFLKEYTTCHIKSKRIKERYKIFINNMSILFLETSLLLHEYLSFKHNIHIVINDMDKGIKGIKDEESGKEYNKQEKIYKLLYIEDFQKLVNSYNEINKSLEQKIKFNTNTIKNINSNLYYYLTDHDEFLKKFCITDKKSLNINQQGKYLKKWILLSEEERLERFYSFSEYFVKKHINLGRNKSENELNKFTERLYDLLKTNYIEKKMVYRDYTWNIKLGIIENVKILSYDKEKEDFIFKYTIVNKKDPVKKVSTKTIITKHIEKIINEELLYFIMKKIKIIKNDSQYSTEQKFTEYYAQNKEDFIDHIKEKLCIKKINKTDKEIIYKTYDNIYEIIKNNSKQ
jgi:hypothetical protein